MKTYYIYHIKGQKVGATNNLERRLNEQGYSLDEAELLETSNCINYISYKEIYYQLLFGYKPDPISYKDRVNIKLNKLLNNIKKNEMELNITEKTTTMPCNKNDVAKYLFKNQLNKYICINGYEKILVTKDIISWIEKNIQSSMYNDNKCYIYNKSLIKFLKSEEKKNNFRV